MSNVARNLLIVGALVVLTAMPVSAQTETVGFPSLDKRFHGQLTATAYMPSGTGPFPAMVRRYHGSGFRAAVALYPVCDYMPRRTLAAPLLVLLGADDNWTGAAPCDRGIKGLAGAGQPAATDARTRVAAFLTSAMK